MSASRKRRRKIPNIKPHRLPVDDLITQIIRNILGLLPLMELQPSSPNYIYLRIVGMGFQMEQILKQIKVGLDPQKSLVKMDENRDVENRARGQVMHLNPPNGNGGPGRNRKQENRGPEEHKEGKQQIRFLPHGEKIPPQIHANG